MNFFGSNQETCGCNTCGNACGTPVVNPCGTFSPTYQQYNQVVQTCNVEEVPHYVNYHTHVVNNFVKRHVNIPTYSTSGENVVINEYAQTPAMANPYIQWQQPNCGCQSMNPTAEYIGNVGTNPYQPQMGAPYMMPQYPNMNMPGRF